MSTDRPILPWVILIALVLALCRLARGDEPDEMPHQPRELGQHAVMHIYYYAPRTLEVTHVMSYLWANAVQCKSAIPKALQIAAPYASQGDRVAASCVEMHPPKADPSEL